MSKLMQFALAAMAAAVLVGCAGSEVLPANTSAPTLSKDRIQSLLAAGVQGIDSLHQQGGTGGLKPAAAGAHKKAPVHRDEPYFDAELELWTVEFSDGNIDGDHMWGKHFFVDEALTQPAGDDVWHSDWSVYPQIDDEVMTVTAGPLKGLRYHDHEELNEDGTGSSVGDGFDPTSGDAYEWLMTWDSTGYASLTEKFTHADGSWIRYTGGPNEDGSHFIVETSDAVKMTLNFAWNGSGTGKIEGPSVLLPATLEWDDAQKGTIHWADGSVTEFVGWNF